MLVDLAACSTSVRAWQHVAQVSGQGSKAQGRAGQGRRPGQSLSVRAQGRASVSGHRAGPQCQGTGQGRAEQQGIGQGRVGRAAGHRAGQGRAEQQGRAGQGRTSSRA